MKKTEKDSSRKRAWKSIKQYAQKIRNSPLLPYAAALLGFAFFHQPLESFIHKFLVVHVFSKVASSPWKDVVVGIVLFLMLLFYVTKRKNYVVSRNITYAILAGAVIYGYYRFFAQVWSFTPWYCWEEVKYADVIFILAGGNILLGWINRPSKAFRKNGTNPFIHDESIESDKEDVLGYSKYAKMLAEKIKASYFNKAFAIGVNGKWGSGKTSFINLLKGKLPKDDLLMIDFNPWNSQSPKAIIQDFFETVQEAIRPYHSSLARLLVQYADKLIALNDNQVAKSIQISIAAFTGHKSLNSLFREINDALRRVNQKIVVFIDDLDRLDSEEIVEVIRLIRNTANFYHTFFVVTYDKGYVIQALQQHNSYHQEQFLEKIFQVEISLPYYRSDILRYKLLEQLETFFSDSEPFHSELKTAILVSPTSGPHYLDLWLESMRDVTRLANVLTLNLINLRWEVDLHDFIRLELLRLKFPAVYELLSKQTEDIFEIKSTQNINSYKLKRNNIQKVIPGEGLSIVKPDLEDYLLEYHQSLFIPKHSIAKIVSFIDDIFGGSRSKALHLRSHLSVVYPSKFNRYFAYNLLEGNLSELEFSKARELLSQDALNAEIKKWIDQGMEAELKHRFASIKGFDDRDDFEKIIRAMVYMANLMRKPEYRSRRMLYGDDIEDFESKINDQDNRLSGGIYASTGGKEGLRVFIRSIFRNANPPFLFEAELIRLFISQRPSSWYLEKSEMRKILLGYLEGYCEQTDQLDDYVYKLSVVSD